MAKLMGNDVGCAPRGNSQGGLLESTTGVCITHAAHVGQANHGLAVSRFGIPAGQEMGVVIRAVTNQIRRSPGTKTIQKASKGEEIILAKLKKGKGNGKESQGE